MPVIHFYPFYFPFSIFFLLLSIPYLISHVVPCLMMLIRPNRTPMRALDIRWRCQTWLFGRRPQIPPYMSVPNTSSNTSWHIRFDSCHNHSLVLVLVLVPANRNRTKVAWGQPIHSTVPMDAPRMEPTPICERDPWIRPWWVNSLLSLEIDCGNLLEE